MSLERLREGYAIYMSTVAVFVIPTAVREEVLYIVCPIVPNA